MRVCASATDAVRAIPASTLTSAVARHPTASTSATRNNRSGVVDPLPTDRRHVGAGPELVHSVGIVSGAAASSFGEAIALGLDAFLTGEPAEHVMADARESGTHFIAAGHYATETFGVRALGDLLADQFGVDHVFVDLSNPV